jgi:hypothetical protein
MKFSLEKFKPKPIKGLECLNCGQPLSGHENYCSYCGQKNTLKKLSIGLFFSNLISGFFSYDSRFWRTFIPLLTRPGQVSRRFIEGKRVRFVNPFQMYLNVSVVFFLILGISERLEITDVSENVLTFQDDSLDSLRANPVQIDSLVNEARTQLIGTIPVDSSNADVLDEMDQVFNMVTPVITGSPVDTVQKPHVYHIDRDSTRRVSFFNKLSDFSNYHKKNRDVAPQAALDSLGYESNFWNTFYFQQVKIGYKNLDEIREDGGKAFFKKMLSQISIALFVFLPVFTLFLKLIYIRRKFTYMEHLVFVFHTQTVFFLILTIFYLLNFFVPLTNFAIIFVLLFLLYLYKALRHFYKQGRFKTFVKFLLLNWYYTFLASIGLGIVAMLSFLTD